MRRIIISTIVVLVLAACAGNAGLSSNATTTSPAPGNTMPAGTPATVVRVLDGDSLVVAIDSEEQEVRLIGVNAPEASECRGDEAKRELEQLVGGGDLSLVGDGEDTDQYGRLLRYLFVAGLDVNKELLAAGTAVALQGGHTADAEFAAISDQAAAEGRGLWAPDACGNSAPLPNIVVTGYVYNPEGRDGGNLNEEWIGLANQGTVSQDMTGWILRDESTQHRYRFPPGFALAPDTPVVVHSGCGPDTATDLHWCSSDPVWSNGGDTVILQLPDGTVVTRVRYAGDY